MTTFPENASPSSTRPESGIPPVVQVPQDHSTKPRDVCDRCSMPAVEIDGVWQHAEAADMVFCAVVFGGAR